MNDYADQSIVITGAGCMLPGCDTPDQLWRRLLASHTAITPYQDEHLDSTLIPCFGSINAEQRMQARDVVPFKLRRYSTPSTQWGIKAASDAIANAGLDLKQIPDERRGLFAAQGDYTFPSAPAFAHGIAAAHERGTLDMVTLNREFACHRGIESFVIIKCLANNLSAIASLTFEMRGDCGAFVQDDSAVIAALRSAMFSLKHGYCDVALLVCAGSYNEALTLDELRKLEYLSACEDGAASLRPFDLRRDGTVLGEGAIAFVLENGAHARLRRAQPLAEITALGSLVAMPGRAHRVDTYRRCIQQALRHTSLGFADIDAIVASGRGGHGHDQREASWLRALQEGEIALPITCATPITGNLPACPIEMLTAIAMLQHQQVPPIAHLEQPIDRTLNLVRKRPVQRTLRRILALSSGYTDHHSAVILSSLS